MADLMVSTVKKLPELQKKDGPCTIGLINAGALRADIDVRFFVWSGAF
jgi:hypothetical protein